MKNTQLNAGQDLGLDPNGAHHQPSGTGLRPFLRRRQAHALESARLAAERQAHAGAGACPCSMRAVIGVLWASPPPTPNRPSGAAGTSASGGTEAKQPVSTASPSGQGKRRARHGNAG